MYNRPYRPGPKTMASKFPGRCHACSCDFPIGTQIMWVQGAGARHATLDQCNDAKKLQQEARAAREAANPIINLSPIRDFLVAAQTRGLKRPKLRVLAEDGRRELRLSITLGGANPGSLSVVEDEVFAGCVRPDGRTTGNLANRTSLQEYLLRIARDPINAAKEYAALMGRCSFCDAPITDAGSVEVGYGPICAKHWGLPHKPKRTPQVGTAPE